MNEYVGYAVHGFIGLTGSVTVLLVSRVLSRADRNAERIQALAERVSRI